jgi:hypothetical protein
VLLNCTYSNTYKLVGLAFSFLFYFLSLALPFLFCFTFCLLPLLFWFTFCLLPCLSFFVLLFVSCLASPFLFYFLSLCGSTPSVSFFFRFCQKPLLASGSCCRFQAQGNNHHPDSCGSIVTITTVVVCFFCQWTANSSGGHNHPTNQAPSYKTGRICVCVCANN